MKWTDNQMEGFAIYCARYYEYVSGGVWRSKHESLSQIRITTNQLLQGYKMQLIPPLPSIDDLSIIQFGQDNDKETPY